MIWLDLTGNRSEICMADLAKSHLSCCCSKVKHTKHHMYLNKANPSLSFLSLAILTSCQYYWLSLSADTQRNLRKCHISCAMMVGINPKQGNQWLAAFQEQCGLAHCVTGRVSSLAVQNPLVLTSFSSLSISTSALVRTARNEGILVRRETVSRQTKSAHTWAFL